MQPLASARAHCCERRGPPSPHLQPRVGDRAPVSPAVTQPGPCATSGGCALQAGRGLARPPRGAAGPRGRGRGVGSCPRAAGAQANFGAPRGGDPRGGVGGGPALSAARGRRGPPPGRTCGGGDGAAAGGGAGRPPSLCPAGRLRPAAEVPGRAAALRRRRAGARPCGRRGASRGGAGRASERAGAACAAAAACGGRPERPGGRPAARTATPRPPARPLSRGPRGAPSRALPLVPALSRMRRSQLVLSHERQTFFILPLNFAHQ